MAKMICAAREVCGKLSCEHAKPHEYAPWKGCGNSHIRVMDSPLIFLPHIILYTATRVKPTPKQKTKRERF